MDSRNRSVSRAPRDEMGIKDNAVRYHLLNSKILLELKCSCFFTVIYFLLDENQTQEHRRESDQEEGGKEGSQG